MLVVVHHRDVQLIDEPALDLKALGGFDILEVDSTEGRGYRLYGLDELVDVRPVDLDVEDVDVCERLEQEGLALHHRLACERTDVT